MKRVMFRYLALAALGVAAVSLSVNAADDKKGGKEPATIEEIMEKAHKKGGALPGIGADLKAKDVKWDAVEAKTKDLLLLAGDLALNKPPKGDQKSWEKLTKAYVANVQKLQKAVDGKDASAARAAHKALSGSCGSCHKAHKSD